MPVFKSTGQEFPDLDSQGIETLAQQTWGAPWLILEIDDKNED